MVAAAARRLWRWRWRWRWRRWRRWRWRWRHLTVLLLVVDGDERVLLVVGRLLLALVARVVPRLLVIGELEALVEERLVALGAVAGRRRRQGC